MNLKILTKRGTQKFTRLNKNKNINYITTATLVREFDNSTPSTPKSAMDMVIIQFPQYPTFKVCFCRAHVNFISPAQFWSSKRAANQYSERINIVLQLLLTFYVLVL
jgi:hypothetical protein